MFSTPPFFACNAIINNMRWLRFRRNLKMTPVQSALLLLIIAVFALSVPLVRGHNKSAVEKPATRAPVAATSSKEIHAQTATHPASAQYAPSERVAPSAAPAADGATRTVSTSTVLMQITDPEGTRSFEIRLHDGATVCDILQEAKDEGSIRSLTLDDSWLATYGSLYVREIDGFSNNWTFSVNGTHPRGCSLYKPRANDRITWKFGS